MDYFGTPEHFFQKLVIFFFAKNQLTLTNISLKSLGADPKKSYLHTGNKPKRMKSVD